MIDKRYLFPAAMIALNLGAAVVRFASGDWRRGIYWISGGVCLACVAFN